MQKTAVSAVQFSPTKRFVRLDFKGLSQCRILIRRPGLAGRCTSFAITIPLDRCPYQKTPLVSRYENSRSYECMSFKSAGITWSSGQKFVQ